MGVSEEIITLLFKLLPGFVAAWIFYGLTAHPRKSPFERAVEALILTALVQVLVVITQELLLYVSSSFRPSLGTWSHNAEYVWSILLAILLGHAFALAANKNFYHSFLEKLGVTQRTSYPSEWFSTFARQKRYVTLHLVGERRIMGWPYEWPDSPNAGHFVLQEPKWLLDSNEQVPILGDEFFLIPATSVEMVEVLKFRGDLRPEELSKIEEHAETLTRLRIVSPEDPDASSTHENDDVE